MSRERVVAAHAERRERVCHRRRRPTKARRLLQGRTAPTLTSATHTALFSVFTSGFV